MLISRGHISRGLTPGVYIRGLITGRLTPEAHNRWHISWGLITRGHISEGLIPEGLITGSIYPGLIYGGLISRGLHSRGFLSRGAYNRGAYNREAYNQRFISVLISGGLLFRGAHICCK